VHIYVGTDTCSTPETHLPIDTYQPFDTQLFYAKHNLDLILIY